MLIAGWAYTAHFLISVRPDRAGSEQAGRMVTCKLCTHGLSWLCARAFLSMTQTALLTDMQLIMLEKLCWISGVGYSRCLKLGSCLDSNRCTAAI